MNETGLVHAAKTESRMTKPTNGRILQALIPQITALLKRLTRPPIRTVKIVIYANLQLSQVTFSALLFASVSKRVCEKAVEDVRAHSYWAFFRACHAHVMHRRPRR